MSVNEMLMAAAGQAGGANEFVEDVFSTFLYQGNGSTQTITNGIDLAGEGGLVWIKRRDSAVSHYLATTDGGTSNYLNSDTTNDYETGVTTRITSFNADGFSLGSAASVNNNTSTFASWTFRKAPKFFDVVTYTGNGVAGRTVAHNLGSVPGMIIVKKTSNADNWAVYHRSLGATQRVFLNLTNAAGANSFFWNDTEPTSTVFTVGSALAVNESGETYVAYLFAHDAGGFGDAGTDNIISCGSFYSGSVGSSGATINLGYEPQFILYKASSSTGNWRIIDNMRGLPVPESGGSTSNAVTLSPNLSDAEGTHSLITINSTGFTSSANDTTYIYMAIRRPMKTPTTGTEVFSPNAINASLDTQVTTGFAIDTQFSAIRGGYSLNTTVMDRLRGVSTNTTSYGNNLVTSSTAAEETANASTRYWNNVGFRVANLNSGSSTIYYSFRRATGFFDVVCGSANGSGGFTLTHNLGVAPELVIFKPRSNNDAWNVYHSSLGVSKYNNLDNAAFSTATNLWTINSTQIGFANGYYSNNYTLVAYLFATVAGVSKVFSYTGNGSSQTINCGFSGGARLVLIKRTDSTGDWYIWDSSRGIVSGNDPRLSLNSTAAEVTSDDTIDPDSSGFVVNQVSATNVNVSSATYIGLAIS